MSWVDCPSFDMFLVFCFTQSTIFEKLIAEAAAAAAQEEERATGEQCDL